MFSILYSTLKLLSSSFLLTPLRISELTSGFEGVPIPKSTVKFLVSVSALKSRPITETLTKPASFPFRPTIERAFKIFSVLPCNCKRGVSKPERVRLEVEKPADRSSGLVGSIRKTFFPLFICWTAI